MVWGAKGKCFFGCFFDNVYDVSEVGVGVVGWVVPWLLIIV